MLRHGTCPSTPSPFHLRKTCGRRPAHQLLFLVTDADLTCISKHILNAQVSIRAPCCKQWFDCPECHAETQTHPLARTTDMTFICKKCKKAFRKDMTEYEESDEYCPHCDNHYVSPSAGSRMNVLFSDMRSLDR